MPSSVSAQEARGAATEKMVPRGLEPRTLRLLAVRSDQLSYETSLSLLSTHCLIDLKPW